MDLRKVFAANLIRLRKKKGLNQSGLAIKAGVNRDYLNRLEQGRFHVSLSIIGKLSKPLKVKPADFLRLPRTVRRPKKKRHLGTR
jgi:transcriptional regulator with XRE-family HTH domain